MTETQVGELLERATADLRSTTDLVAGGIAAGRRRRRRGLALTAAGSLAAAAVMGGALVAVSGNGTGADRTVVADPSGAAGTSSYAAQPSASAVSQAPPVSDGPFPVSPDAMAATLAPLLDGTVSNPSNDQYHLSAPDGWQSGGVDLDGASVSVSIQHSTGPRCDGDMDRGDTSCTALGNGFFLATYSAEIEKVGVGKTGVRDVGVTYYTPAGYKINATASNGSSTDTSHPTMADPVLDLDALTAIAENPVWQGQ
jgi:hypothetical protein